MTSFFGTIQGLGGVENRTVRKTGTTIKLSVYDNIDRVIEFNEAGETSQETLSGKNLFVKGTSSSSADVTYTVNSDGSITLSGTSSAVSFFTAFENVPINSGTYTLSPTGYSDISFYIRKNTASGDNLMNASESSATATLEAQNIAGIIRINSGTNCNGITLYPQFEAGSSPTEYEPYCGGVPSPNPSYPQDIVGIGTKQLDDTYSVSIDYDDGDGRTGTITASGLAYPLYEGDILDFVNGKVIRATGIYAFDGTEGWEYITSWADDGFRLAGSNFTNKVTNAKVGGDYRIRLYKYVGNTYTAWNLIPAQGNNVIGTLSNLAGIVIRDDSIIDATTFKNTLVGEVLVYSLETPVNEYITLTGDISDIGTATVTADGTLTVKYDKVEMAIRKYSNPPAWSEIGYSDTPNEIINAFNYAKEIRKTYTSSSFYTNDKNLMFWPDIDITGRSNYNAFFDRSNLIHTPPLTLGISGTNPTLTRAFRETRIEDIEISTIESNSYSISCSNTFIGCANLKTVKINCEVGALEYMFSGCTSLTTVNDFTHSISSVVTASETFKNCSSLVTAPNISNFSSITAMNNFFNGCTLLENIPIYDTSAITSWSSAFANCNSLNDTSLDNILVMCINATAYNGTKKLSTLGISNTYDTRIALLPHYNDFLTAGWIIR